MANIAIWPGSSSFVNGSTPFGFYDADAAFAADADKVARWCANRLGYPIMDVELQDIHFYTAFEEAVTEYGRQVNEYNIRNNIFNLLGATQSINITGQPITTNLSYTIALADEYGSEAGVGGTVDYRTGSIAIQRGVQDYDLNTLFRDVTHPGEQIEIKRIYHFTPPALVRYFDPFIDTGIGGRNFLNEMGFTDYSPAVSFILMPMYEDLLRLQAIEFNDLIRKSGYSFRLVNNKLQIMPIPTKTDTLWFDYIVKSDRSSITRLRPNATGSYISDASNVPYNTIPYAGINSVGRQWVYKYALAVAKEILGLVRGKYQSIDFSGNENVQLNSGDLIQQANEEKTQLIEQLREFLEANSKRNQLERQKEEAEFLNEQLQRIPLLIYVR